MFLYVCVPCCSGGSNGSRSPEESSGGLYADEGSCGGGSPTSRRFANRNAWSRTSIRRSSCSSKRLGASSLGRDVSAAAVANASLNSALSRRSSFSFDLDHNNELDSFADQQMVDDLTDKVQIMELRMSALSEDLSTNKDLYQRVKQENSGLTHRIHVLEENIRELEVKSEERLREERRQFSQMMERKDRERGLEVEQHVAKILELQKEHMSTKEEAIKLRAQNEQLRQEKKSAVEQCQEAAQELQTVKQEFRAFQETSRKEREDFLKEKQLSQQVMQELTQRLEEIQQLRRNSIASQEGEGVMRERSASFIQNLPLHYETMEKELERLRLDNRRLKERNEEIDEELMGLKVGRGQRLLHEGDSASQENNWAAETDNLAMLSKEELVSQLRRLKDTNLHLREYIGTVLSNIILTNPQVLERKA